MTERAKAMRRVELTFDSGQRLESRTESGGALVLDGDHDDAQSPMEGLLSSVGACMGIDVALILAKMRIDTAGMRITVEGERAEEHPRRFVSLRFEFHLRRDVDRDKAERAVQLSLDKYCSVFHTLRKDLEVETEVHLDQDG